MIYYFSGTGNSRCIAVQLAARTSDVAQNLVGQTTIPSLDELSVGLVFPVYAWGVPEPVLDFVKQLRGQPTFSFGVCSCGGEAGLAMDKLSQVFHLDSAYSIRMPNNYVMGSELESADRITLAIVEAKKRIDRIATQIIAKQPASDVDTGRLAWVKSNLFNMGFNKAARRTRPFFVTDKCISCGICARDCPAKTITMVEGRPEWGKKCYQCTACINLCPTRAIEYGKGTAARGRYRIEDYLDQVAPA